MPKFRDSQKRSGGENNNYGNSHAPQHQSRSGVRPNIATDGVPYTISTEDARVYLQKKIDTMTAAMRNNPNTPIDAHININLVTIDAGRRFLPFVMIIPETALVSYYTKNDEDRSDEIIPIDDEEEDVKLLKEFMEVIKPFKYTNQDKKLFRSDHWRYETTVARSALPMLFRMIDPVMYEFDSGNDKRIVMLIDPLKVFHDMLVYNDDNRKFMVYISTVKKKHKDGLYSYRVTRNLLTGKRKNGKSISRQLNAAIHRGGKQ